METLDFTKDVKEIKLRLLVNGQEKEYAVSMPLWKHNKLLAKQMKDVEEGSDEQLQAMENYLQELGLPSEALNELSSQQIKKLTDKLGAVDVKK